MRQQLRRILTVATAIMLACAVRAQAQVVTAPTTTSFQQPDSEYTRTLSAHLDFYQCASVLAGACVGQAPAPFQSGADIPKALISTLAPPDADGNNRTFSLVVAPANGLLQAAPAGVGFVATLQIVGDPAQGLGGTSARSAASNPFFASLKVPAAVPAPKVR